MKRLIPIILMLFLLMGCGKPSGLDPESTLLTEITVSESTEITETATLPSEATDTTVDTTPESIPVEIIGKVTISALNVRSHPGTENRIVSELKKNDTVSITERVSRSGENWGHIESGWVLLDHVKLTGKINDIPKTDELNGHKHLFRRDVTAPTCLSRGFTTNTCSCGEQFLDTYTAAPGHQWSSWKTTVAPTQSAEGTQERKCSACGEKEQQKLDKLIPQHTHSYQLTNTILPSCTTAGSNTYTCPCGSSYKDSVPAKEHQYTKTVVAPTCTAQGYTNYVCSRCKDTYKDALVSASGHSWGDWKITTEPTVTATGSAKRSCSVCKASETKVLDKLPEPSVHTHTYVSYEKVAPTCNADGYYKTKCSGCGEIGANAPTYELALGHAYAETNRENGTCSAPGFVEYQCSRCGSTYRDPLTVAHTWVHHHKDGTGHWGDVYMICHCGWRYNTANGGAAGAFAQHVSQFTNDPEEYNRHSYTEQGTWIQDTPAEDWDACSVCGARK